MIRTRSPSPTASGYAQHVLLSQSCLNWSAVALIVIVAWFFGLDIRKLQHSDEGRYAEIAREMAVTGDYVTPRLNGLKYFEKPPLQYWLTAAAFRAFGVNEWTARLTPALTGFLAIVIVGFVTFRVTSDARAGIYAALILASTVMHVVMSHIVTLDSLLTFCLTGALGCFLLAQRDGQSRERVRALTIGAYAFAAFATLAKGLVALVVIAASLMSYTLLTRDVSPWRRLHALPGGIVFLAVTLPWFVLVSRANPEFARFFFLHEHFQRFLTTTHRREGAWWYFVPLFALGILPWLGLLLLTTLRAWRDAPRPANGFRWPRFCLVWALFVFAFFSLSGSKLPSYILPMFPPLAMVLGWQLSMVPDQALRRAVPLAWLMTGVVAIGLGITLFAYIPLVNRFASDRAPIELFHEFRPWAIAATAMWLAGSIVAALAFTRPGGRNRNVGVVALAVATLLGLQVAFIGDDAFRPIRSSSDILRDAKLTSRLEPDAPFFQLKAYDQTVPFHLGRTTTLVAFVDEFALGIAAEPWKAIAKESDWIAIWLSLPVAYALIQNADYERLAKTELPMRMLARDPRRVLVARK